MLSRLEFEYRYGLPTDHAGRKIVEEIPILPSADQDKPYISAQVALETIKDKQVSGLVVEAGLQPEGIAGVLEGKIRRSTEMRFRLGTAMSVELDLALEIATRRAILEEQTHVQPRHILYGLIKAAPSVNSTIESFGTEKTQNLVHSLKK